MSTVSLPPSVVDAEAEYAAQRRDEAELIAKFPGLRDKTDAELITAVADPFALPGEDPDEIAAAAAVVLAERLDGVTPWRP